MAGAPTLSVSFAGSLAFPGQKHSQAPELSLTSAPTDLHKALVSLATATLESIVEER